MSETQHTNRAHFGKNIEVWEFGAALDGSKLPAKGPAIGLGKLKKFSIRRLESFEQAPKQGVNALSARERLAVIDNIHRRGSIEEAGREAADINRALVRSRQEFYRERGNRQLAGLLGWAIAVTAIPLITWYSLAWRLQNLQTRYFTGFVN